MPADLAQTTNVWQAFPDPDQFGALLNDMEGGRTNKFILENNNPGNLKDSAGNFVKFGSWEEGRQALLNKMHDWQQRFPNMTIAQFNRRYAPDKSHGGDNADGTEAGRNQRMLTAMSGTPSTQGQPRSTASTSAPSSGGMTIPEFAARIREQLPQLQQAAPISDADLVREVVRLRPELITKLTAGPTRLPQPREAEITPGERIGLGGLGVGGALGNVLLGAAKRSGRELATGGGATTGLAEAQSSIPGFWGSRPAAPVESPPQEEAFAQQFQARHPTLANLGGAISGLAGRLPGGSAARTATQAIPQLTTPTGTAQQVGQYIPDVTAIAPILRDLPGLARGAYQVVSGIRTNPFIFPNTALRNIAETVAPETFRRTMQRVAGAGPEAVAEDVRTAQEANLEALGKHKEAVANAEREHADAVRKYLDKKAAGEQADAEKLRQTRKAWVDRQAEYRSAQRQVEAIRNQQESLIRGRNELADRARQNLTDTYKIAESRLNSRAFHIREAIEAKLPGGKGYLNSPRIQMAIDDAKEKFLVGSPENLKVFNDLTHWIAESGGGDFRNIPWQDGWIHHSAMGNAIREGNNLPGNVVQAIRYVREHGTGPELMRIAEAAGEGERFAAFRRDYRQFRIDWSDPGAVSLGGSPLRPGLARTYNAPLIKDVTGDSGGLFLRTLAKYKNHGANMRLFEDMRSLTARLENLPKVRIPTKPGVFEPPETSKPLTPPDFPEVKRPSVRISRPAEFRQERLRRWVGRPYTTRELQMFRGHAQRMLRHWLSDPAFQERVAQQLPRGGGGLQP